MRGALIVDTRTETQRAEAGELPGALVIDRTVLDWHLDPASYARIAEATTYDIEVVVVCRQGYGSRRKACAGWACTGRPTLTSGSWLGSCTAAGSCTPQGSCGRMQL